MKPKLDLPDSDGFSGSLAEQLMDRIRDNGGRANKAAVVRQLNKLLKRYTTEEIRRTITVSDATSATNFGDHFEQWFRAPGILPRVEVSEYAKAFDRRIVSLYVPGLLVIEQDNRHQMMEHFVQNRRQICLRLTEYARTGDELHNRHAHVLCSMMVADDFAATYFRVMLSLASRERIDLNANWSEYQLNRVSPLLSYIIKNQAPGSHRYWKRICESLR